ncbi:transcriptional regulator [Natrinema mahii]|uniref:Transcription regulator AsnC-type n=2 Tax=Natrinema TaxID=88723 RepID=L0JRH6_NATP1|nr:MULTISPECIES: Lrp/AsnC family transcriptional regulator [Natrinema]ELZ11951.1 Transcription regulator AsnC-type [Natrinema thermotolerans DSM 11552]OAQ53323.1 transcriptional regulator [Natrinema mahii]AGB33418.1 transcriptional regulator [Natrinema pellirubrum DSM 15624]ELY71246.1 Transcription regulator AsnC-type [Natrinema pellirubrum DSM 15624]QCC58638.1 Lrp/AsnC family transcriptional regulator [Natrinema thermotolerans]
MAEYELDAVDREILYALQEEARNLSSSEIADRTDASSSTVRKRIQRLESEGVIKGYSANIDYTKSGYPIRMLLFCTAPIPDRGEYIDDLLEISGVVSVQELITGERNLLVTVVVENDRAVTPIAQQIADMGLTITDEVLVRSHRSTSFDEFSS